MRDLWRDADAVSDELSQLVYLSRLIGADPSLVQPGGGNTSLKLEETDPFGCRVSSLAVKGSGTDLRTIDAAGFTRLYLDRLSLLRDRSAMSDEEMMRLMRACMLSPERDPLPSVETPLHSLLAFRFVAHTHDVATLTLTDTPHAEQNARRLYGPDVAFLEYVRPGFPLARRMAERYGDGPPPGTTALLLEKHGLVVWGESAKECYANLRAIIGKAQAFVAERATGKRVFGPAASPALTARRRRQLAARLMPLIRGELAASGWLPILHFDDSPQVLDAIAGERFPRLAALGVMTPEHILRCGRLPLVFDVRKHLAAPSRSRGASDALAEKLRAALRAFRERYVASTRAHGQDEPIADFLKVVLLPGLGMVCAGKDKRSATVAAACYRATLAAIAGAQAVERFRFLDEAHAIEMEYWPLERRKMSEAPARDLAGKVAVVVGAASGIGRETALRLAGQGAHVVASDVDRRGVERAAAQINAGAPEHACALPADIADEAAVQALFQQAALQFGGVDILFYSPGVGPRFQSVLELSDKEVEEKMAVHYRGAVAATREAARLMLDQGRGGRLIYNASKAAYVPGEGFAAYGASKAALVQYVRNVAAELGRQGITANYINADAVDTPMFRGVLRERAARAGGSEEATLKRYAERSVFGTATVPPQAVAEAVLWLASAGAAYTTGCVITIGGGHEGFPR